MDDAADGKMGNPPLIAGLVRSRSWRRSRGKTAEERAALLRYSPPWRGWPEFAMDIMEGADVVEGSVAVVGAVDVLERAAWTSWRAEGRRGCSRTSEVDVVVAAAFEVLSLIHI